MPRFSVLPSFLLLLLSALASTHVVAQQMAVSVEVPRLRVAEYHNPYVAIWVQDEQGQVATNLAVWYDLALKNREGEKWLKDMRLWWRRSGRSLEMPVDGVTGATRSPGTHKLQFQFGEIPLGQLAPGNYRLMVEAAREVGGRETVEIPFTWPPQHLEQLNSKGNRELGAVGLKLLPEHHH